LRKDVLKVSILELKVKSENQVTSIKFKNVDVNIKTSYLKSLKDPEKYVNNLWHKKTETQIRHLAKENRGAEIKGLNYLQKRAGFETTLPTASIIDEIDANKDIYTQMVDEVNKKTSDEEAMYIITVDEDGNVHFDDIGIS